MYSLGRIKACMESYKEKHTTLNTDEEGLITATVAHLGPIDTSILFPSTMSYYSECLRNVMQDALDNQEERSQLVSGIAKESKRMLYEF